MKCTLSRIVVGTIMALSMASHPALADTMAGCYVDSPALDTARPNFCEGVGTSRTGTAVFEVMGIDQSTGRYTIQYLDGTCASVFYTRNEGWVCFRSVGNRHSITQRVSVTDTSTGVTQIPSATASYEYEDRR